MIIYSDNDNISKSQVYYYVVANKYKTPFANSITSFPPSLDSPNTRSTKLIGTCKIKTTLNTFHSNTHTILKFCSNGKYKTKNIKRHKCLPYNWEYHKNQCFKICVTFLFYTNRVTLIKASWLLILHIKSSVKVKISIIALVPLLCCNSTVELE